ncbi:MAG: sulfotransferase domain-containing protein [Deltaproteobacteria bacterium]|nr:sulfotransferase domain-containing protein [Deltaproteobacteria bacterium]
MNSIPKSGTNLLENALLNLPSLRGGLLRTLMTLPGISDEVIAARIRGIKKGQFIVAHLTANPGLLSLVHDEGIRSLLMVRDPRDIAVSHFKYLTGMDLTHRFHGYFASLPNDDARLMASIDGVVGALRDYADWLDDPGTLVVRFEDLIGPAGGGSQDRQLKAVGDIASHLGIVISEKEIQEISLRIFSTKTPTFRSGRIGGWKKTFKPEHVKAFKDIAGDLILRYGYENDVNW